MFRTFTILLAAQLLAQAPSNWQAATVLPGVEMKNLTPAQQKVVLTVLRDTSCACGCGMKVAQCRIEDPPCGQSLTLATMVVEAVAANKSASQIRKILEDSPLVKAATQRSRVLLDPVAINIQGAPFKGPANAKVTIIEFSDFQCPFCVKAIPEIEALMKAFPNDIRLVYKQFPLDTHSQAALASRASLAAHAQGKFWPLHDKLYANSRLINRDAVMKWAKEFGLDLVKFPKIMDAPETQAAVDRDISDGTRAGVDSTPTIYINGKKYQREITVALLTPIVTSELKGK